MKLSKLPFYFSIATLLFFLVLNCKKKEVISPPLVPVVVLDTLSRSYEADNTNIQYSGRISFTDPKKPKFSVPGVYIKAKFEGVSCSVMFKDQHLWGGKNYYNVIIDGKTTYKITPVSGTTTYSVVSGLTYGAHTVTFVKRTEAGLGNCEFMGFIFGGKILSPDAKPTRKIEFIGNSISCGSGNEAVNNSSQCSEDGWGQPYHNNYMAFGPIMARSLNAEYHTIAVSGIGLKRNYSDLYDARPMPQVYNLLYPELQTGSPTWDVTKFVPDAIVIELGTNDFSPGDTPRPNMDSVTYVDAYIPFINTLRGYYPNAHIFCISSPMLGDGWPLAGDLNATNLNKSLAGLENYFIMNGDPKVHKFYVTKIFGTGCGVHPSTQQHINTANELEIYVKSVMGW